MTSNMKGALFMALAMAGFTINDALTKSVTHLLTVGQIMVIRGALTSLLVYGIARFAGASMSLRLLSNPLVLVRVGCEMLSSIFYLTALGQMPLANAAAILQSLPLAVTLGAAIFFRQPVGWRRWAAIIVGFAGVLIILRPGPDGFTFAALYVLGSVFLAASRDLVTSRIHASTPSITITLFTALGSIVAGALLLPFQGGWQPVTGGSLLILCAAAIMLFVGYQAIILAMRTAEISFISPFRYTSLLWAIGLSVVVFGDWPTPSMLLGMAIVVGSGLYALNRERRRRQVINAPDSPA